MILGLLLCCGGGWIIQDDVTSRHQLRLHYEAEIHDGVDNMKLTKEIPGYYSIFSDQNQWINYGCVSLVIGAINIMISLVMLCIRPDDCLCCMILNYCIILTIGMSLSAGASIITYLRYEEALSLQTEIIYHYMTIYFMGLGFLFALLIAVLLGISWGSLKIRNQKINGFHFKTLQEP